MASFNTTAAPLTIASLTPASVPAGAGALDVTINGTGFTPTTFVNWNGASRGYFRSLDAIDSAFGGRRSNEPRRPGHFCRQLHLGFRFQ